MAPMSHLKLYTNARTRGAIVEWCAALCTLFSHRGSQLHLALDDSDLFAWTKDPHHTLCAGV